MLNENDDEQTHDVSGDHYADLRSKLTYVAERGAERERDEARRGLDFISSGGFDSLSDEQKKTATAYADGMYSSTKESLDDFTPEERRQRAEYRTKVSDDIRAKMQFVVDQNDEDFPNQTNEARRALDYLNTNSLDGFSDADVAKMRQNADELYNASEKRRGHWQVFTDALKRGWQSAGRMAIEGGLMLKPGELTDEDRATIRALKTAGEQYDIAHPKRTGDIREIGSAGDVIDYVAELAGENAVRTGAAVGIGTIGAIAAPAVGATAAVGGVVGGALGGLAFNTGEAVEDQTDENLDVSRALALAQGVGYSALDTIGVVPVVGKLFGKAVAQAGKKAVGTALTQGLREVGKAAVVKGAAKELAKTAVEEAVGEAAQSQVVGRGRRYLQTGSALKEGETPGEAFWEGVNEFVGGLVMGATLGGGPIAANTAGARRKVGIARSIAGKMGADEAFQSLSPEYQMLVGRHLMNESLLATERYASVLSDEERSFLAAQNADIEKDLQEDENAGAARAVLDGMTTAYKLESKEAVVEAARANGEVSNIDFQAIRDTEHEIESQDGKRVLAYYDKGTKQHLYRVVNGQDVGKDVWLLTPPHGVKASIDGETAFGDLPSALKAMEDNDIYNRYVAKNSGSKRSVIKQMVEKMYNGEVNLEIADGALALNERMRGQYMQSGGFAAAYDPDTNTLHVLTDKIKSLGQLYTVIAHEGMHKEIADYIKDSGRDKVDGGDLKAGRKRLFSGQENGGFGERFGVEADEAGEEVIVERASVEKIVNALQSQDRTLVGEGVSRVVDAVKRMMGEHTGFTANAITDADVREELSFLLDRGDFGIKATVNGGNEVASESAVARGERELADQESQERFKAQSAEKQARQAKIAAKSAEIKGNIARKEAEMADLRDKTDYQSVLDRDEMVEEELPSGPFSEEDKLIELWPKSYAKFLSDLKLKDDKNSRKRFFDTVQGGDRTVLVDEGASSESDENGATGVPGEKGTTSRPEAAKPVDKPNPSSAKPSRYGNEKQTAFFKDWMDEKPEGTTLIGTKLNEKGALVIRSTDADGKTTDTYVSKDGVSFVESAKVVNKQGKVLAGTAAQHAIDTKEESKARRVFAEENPGMAEFNYFVDRGEWLVVDPGSMMVRNRNGKGFHKEFMGGVDAEALNQILDGFKGKDRENVENILFGRDHRTSVKSTANDEVLENFIKSTGGDPKDDPRAHDYGGFIRRFLDQYAKYDEWKKNGMKTKEQIAAENAEAEAKAREVKIGGDSYDIENLAEEGTSRELYDTALAEVEQNGEAVQMFGRGELKKLNGGDIIRFDHADSDWIVESYDDAAGEIVVTANDVADNPLFTDEEKKELTGRRFRITERGWVELKTKEAKNGTESKTGKGTDETVAGNAQGERKAGGEDLKLESASQKELNDEQKRNAQRKAVAEKQSAPLEGGTGEVGQTLMDLGGAEGEDLFNRTQKSEQKPGVSKTETTTSTAEKRSEVPTVEEAKAAAKVLGMDAYIPDESLKRKIAGWTRGADKSPLWKAKVDAAKVILADRAAKGKADAKSTEVTPSKKQSVTKEKPTENKTSVRTAPEASASGTSEKPKGARVERTENTTPTDEGFAAWAVDRDGNPLEFATDSDRKQSRSLFDYMVKQRLVDGKTGKSNVRFKRALDFQRTADGSLDYEGEFNVRLKRTVSTAGKYAGELRKLAHGMKRGDMKSLLIGADMMSPLIPQNAVIVPMPNHEGKPIRTMLLGYCISGVRDDVDVVPALLANPHEGSYHDKKIHKRPNVTMHRDESVTIPEGRPVVVIDNVIASGATWAAAQKVLPDADLVTLADARRKAAQDLYNSDPDFVFSKGEWEYAPKWTAPRLKRAPREDAIESNIRQMLKHDKVYNPNDAFHFAYSASQNEIAFFHDNGDLTFDIIARDKLTPDGIERVKEVSKFYRTDENGENLDKSIQEFESSVRLGNVGDGGKAKNGTAADDNGNLAVPNKGNGSGQDRQEGVGAGEAGSVRLKRTEQLPTAAADDPNVVFGSKDGIFAKTGLQYDFERIGDRAVMDAGAEIARDSAAVNAIIDKVTRGDAPSSTDLAALIHAFADKVVDLNGLRNSMDAQNGKDRANEEAVLDAASERLIEGLRLAGSRSGHALQMLKIGIGLSGLKDNYYYLASEVRAIKARQGLDPTLTDAERKMLEEQAAKLKELNDKLNAELAKRDTRIADLEAMNRQLIGLRKQTERKISEAIKKQYGIKDSTSANIALSGFGKFFTRAEGARLARSGGARITLNDELRKSCAAALYSVGMNETNARNMIRETFGDEAAAVFDEYLSEIGGVSDREQVVRGQRDEAAKSEDGRLAQKKARLDRKRNDAIRALDEADDDLDARRKAIAKYLRDFMKYIVEADPSLSNEDVLQRMADEASAIDPRGKYDATEMLSVVTGRRGFDMQTREATEKRMGELMKALELARKGLLEDAARVAGIPYRGGVDRLEKMERDLKRMLREKDDRLMDLLANPPADKVAQVEEINRLKAEIAETAEMIRMMRKEIAESEKRQRMIEMLTKQLEARQNVLSELGEKNDPERKARLDGEIETLRRSIKSVNREISIQRSLNDQIEELERRIRENDFETAPVRPRTERSPEVNALMARRDALRRQLQHQRKMYQYKKRPLPFQMAIDFVHILAESKAIVGSLDLSSMFRQGGQLTFAHPLLFVKNFKKTIEAFKSDDAAVKMMGEILSRPNAKYYKDAGIDFTDWGDGAMSADDRFALYNNAGEGRKLLDFYNKVVKNRLVKAGVNASERAFAMYLNLMRADAFDQIVRNSPFVDASKMNRSQLKALGNFINIASQRGSIEKGSNLGKAINWMNYVLWSPRNLISRFQFLYNTVKLATPGANPYGDKTLRGLFAKELVRYVAGVVTTITFAKLMSDLLKGDDEPPDEIEFDPRSSQFLRVKFGNTRVEFLSGLAQILTFSSRWFTGKNKNSRGQLRDTNFAEAFGKFVRTKLSPGASFFWDYSTGETFEHQDIVWDKPWASTKEEKAAYRHFAETFVPLTLTDLIEQGKYSGLDNTAVTAFLTILGAGVNAYDPLTYKQMTGDFHYYKRLYAESPEDERRRIELYHPMIRRAGAIEANIKRVNSLRTMLKKIEANGGDATAIRNAIERQQKVVINLISGAPNPSQVD